MFSQACVKNSVQGGVYTTGQTLPRQTPPLRDSHCSGRYASYWNAFLLPLATKLGQGYVFTGVCDSVNRGGTSHPPSRSRHTPPPEQTPPGADTPPEQTPPRSRHPPPWEQTSRPACCEIRSTRGRYASYWNAILFLKDFWS